jgi:hypothetical protein
VLLIDNKKVILVEVILKHKSFHMRYVYFVCALLLFIALADLPSGFYTFLRIVVFISSVIGIIQEVKNGINFWVIAFGLLGILFNPIIPVYLYDRSLWAPIDVIAGIVFIVKGVVNDKT